MVSKQCETAESTFLKVGESGLPRDHKGNEVGEEP